MKINWKIRLQNPLFVAQIAMSIVTPILMYNGMTGENITSWNILGDLLCQAVSNPYLLAMVGVSVFNAIVDPTSKGVKDSKHVLSKKGIGE